MAMMAPSMVMAATPSMVMTAATVMAPAMAVAVYLEDCGVSADKCIRISPRHCRRRQNWSESKSAGCKSDQ
jgi:hypothetical protein